MSTEDVLAEWKKYICRACGLIYDEELGDPDSGLAPGTRFEDIPDDWECPLCGVTKTDFDLLEENTFEVPSIETTAVHQTGVIVIGGGIAGWTTVEAIRAHSDTPITLISACAGDRYHKPELSLAIGRNSTPELLIRETGIEAAKRLGIQLISETFVVSLDSTNKRVRTTRGNFDYTDLVIAQGSRPIIPAQLKHDRVWHVNHLKKWSDFSDRLGGGGKRIAILGAGMVGCELAEDLAQSGHKVSLIDRNSLPLSTLLPELAAARVLSHLGDLGVNFIGSSSLESVGFGKEQIEINLDRQNLSVDEIVIATGLLTENRLARLGDIEFDAGFCVDPNTMQTSQKHIYALGDCSSVNGVPCRFIEPIQHQAHAIAAHILGLKEQPYDPVPPVIRIKTPLLPVVMHGSPLKGVEWTIIEDVDGHLVMQQIVAEQVKTTLEIGKKSRQKAA